MLDLLKIEPPYLQLSTQIGNTCDVQRHNKIFHGKNQTHEGGSIGKYGYCHSYNKQCIKECNLQAQKEPFKSKSIIKWEEEEKFHKSFEVVIHNM